MSVLRIFSYLPNPRVWKATIAARLCGVDVDLVGAKPRELGGWLWDFDARPLAEDEQRSDSPHRRPARRGFSGALYKTDAFLEAHPFGTVPAAFSPDGQIGIFESNSILRAVARAGGSLYGDGDPYAASRIDSFLDADLVFAREAQVYLLAAGSGELTAETRERMAAACEFYLSGISAAVSAHPFVCGDTLSIADIAFACDFSQFQRERFFRTKLAAAGFLPIVDEALQQSQAAAFRHLDKLIDVPEIAADLGSYVAELESA